VTRIVYIGDEATAAGYRSGGVETRVPSPVEAGEAVRLALEGRSDLVLVSATLAQSVPRALLDTALAGAWPLVALVPDLYGNGPVPDVAREVRRALGIEP
jgi:vacuolar-type H+-ATPase subunit F/Vma7